MKNLNSPLEYATAAIETMMRKFAPEDLPPKDGFHYHQGVFLDGVYRNYLHSRNEAWYAYMKAWIDHMVDENGHVRFERGPQLDDMQAATLLYPIYERTGERKYKNLLDEIMAQLLHYPRNQEGGFWHMPRFPHQMWLDGLYMAGPIACKYGKMFNQPEFFDLSIEQALLMQKNTRDSETGLMYHAYDESRAAQWADKETGCSPEFWGRAIGWVPVALLEDLDYIPKEHPKYEALCDMVRDLLVSLCKYQSEDGRWYQVVNKGHVAGNWLENSCSCLYTAALFTAVKKGILDAVYLENAWHGYKGVVSSLTWDGDDLQVGNVCIGTGVGDYDYYIGRPVHSNDLHGMGAFLIMSAAAQSA